MCPLKVLVAIWTQKARKVSQSRLAGGEDFSGADATASWWHRNFRMYAQIQRHAAPGARVLVVGGQGHTAILRDFLRDDALREAVAFAPFIE